MARKKKISRDPAKMPGIPINAYVVFIRRLAYLLKANVGIGKALQSLGRSETNEKLKRKAFSLARRVESGKNLSRAFHEEEFPSVLVDLCKSGERTGSFHEMLEEYSKTIEMEAEVLRKFKTALIMPKVTLCLMWVLLYVVLQVAFPKFEGFLAQTSISIPPLSAFMFHLSKATRGLFGGILYFLPLVAAFLVPRIFHINLESKILRAIPKLKAVYVKQEWIRWTNSLGILLHGKANMVESLEASKSLFPVALSRNAEDVIQRVTQGRMLSRALVESCGIKAIPAILTSLIETGEETSQVDEGLLYVAETFGKEVLEETRRLSAIIDPVVTLGLGSMVLLVAVSIFLPMIQAVSSISNM